MPADASGRAEADTAGWRPVTRSLTYQLVVEAVEQQILSGALKVGDHLDHELVGERAGDRPPPGGVRLGSTGCVSGHTV